ncbi:Uncharacterized protein dnm_002520 [Desulfonema magnum]|uniref:Uncharacterized protein n=1 Tax=Desulfonema magnum TaxID=45655 RepID=A0A975BFC7_9BACT|nr:Uncharacterized protein dnm_002520 [Desulfonema magnum]
MKNDKYPRKRAWRFFLSANHTEKYRNRGNFPSVFVLFRILFRVLRG